MSKEFEEFKYPSRRLPEIRLASSAAGAESVRPSGRRSRVLVLLDSLECEDCLGYVRRLTEYREQIAEWDGEVRLVVPDLAEGEGHGGGTELSPYTVLQDPELRLSAGLGVDHPAVVLADQWGVVRLVQTAGSGHEFVAPGEIVEWLRFIAIQCPECEGEAY
jgi:hypothetical protein